MDSTTVTIRTKKEELFHIPRWIAYVQECPGIWEIALSEDLAIYKLEQVLRDYEHLPHTYLNIFEQVVTVHDRTNSNHQDS